MADIKQIQVSNTTYDIKDQTARDMANQKAPIASPAFTGTPTAPTAAKGTNTTQIATTAFVKTAVQNVGSLPSVTTADSGKVLMVNSFGNWAAANLPTYDGGVS